MKTAAAFLTVLFLLAAVAAAQAEVKAVYFLHKTKTQGVLQLDCDKDRQGNARPVYTCYDQDGNEQPITPGPEWQLAELSQVCLHNTVTDTVKDCIGIAAPGKPPEMYVCQNDRGKFFRPSAKWEKLNADDGRCAPGKKEVVELIKGDSSASRPSQIEWSENDAGQE